MKYPKLNPSHQCRGIVDLRQVSLTKLQCLLPVPGAPVVIQDVMPHTSAHLTRAECEGVHVAPVGLDAFSVRVPNLRKVIERILRVR